MKYPALNTLRRAVWALTAIAVLIPSTASAAFQDTRTQQNMYQLGIHFYDVAGDCDTSTGAAIVTGSGDADLSLTAGQVAIAKTIIGVAKTEGLGQQGALIALMVAIDESELQIYANTNVPVSTTNPNKQATEGGPDADDSLGVFQQRIGSGWSTISSDPGNKDAVFQLMDPAYSAEAFFGSPPDSSAPAALSLGLQNKAGWQSLDTWVAAQKVQASFDPTGSNYKAHLPEAQSILDKYYDSSDPVPLPVPITGGGAKVQANTDECQSSTTCDNITAPGAAILCAAQKYNGIYYEFGGGHQGYDAYKSGCPGVYQNPPVIPDNRATGGPSLDGGDSGNPSPCGLDCSALVSMAVDDAFDQKFSWSVATLESDTANWKQLGSVAEAQPGDVVTLSAEHVEIFVSASNGQVNTFGSHYTGTQTGATSAGAGYYDAAYRYIGPGSNAAN